jgi:hypothetical protein
MRRLLAKDVRLICFGMVSWIPQNGFVGRVFGEFLRFFGARRPADSRHWTGQIEPVRRKIQIKTIIW